jgi:tRNA(Ile2) C34 agmatinyltransferase TiaS
MSRKYTSLDMVRMAEFAKENQGLNRITLIQEYNKEFPKVTKQSMRKNVKALIEDAKPRCPHCFSVKVTAWGVNDDWICGSCRKDFKQ